MTRRWDDDFGGTNRWGGDAAVGAEGGGGGE